MARSFFESCKTSNVESLLQLRDAITCTGSRLALTLAINQRKFKYHPARLVQTTALIARGSREKRAPKPFQPWLIKLGLSCQIHHCREQRKGQKNDQLLALTALFLHTSYSYGAPATRRVSPHRREKSGASVGCTLFALST